MAATQHAIVLQRDVATRDQSEGWNLDFAGIGGVDRGNELRIRSSDAGEQGGVEHTIESTAGKLRPSSERCELWQL